MLTLRGYGAHLCLACSIYSWNTIGGHHERTKDIFAQQLAKEGVDAAVYYPKQELPPFRGSLLDYHLISLFEKDFRREPLKE